MDCTEAVLQVKFTFILFNHIHIQLFFLATDMDEISLDLCRPNEDIPRFTVYILDQKTVRGNGKFAIFIVPQGR